MAAPMAVLPVKLRAPMLAIRGALIVAGRAGARLGPGRVRVLVSSKLYDGVIFEYRVGGVLRAVLTGIIQPDGVVLQHVMAWPTARRSWPPVPSALLRAVATAENETRAKYDPAWIVLDIEHAHPMRDRLVKLAERRGYRSFNRTEVTTWFVKYFSRRTHEELSQGRQATEACSAPAPTA